MSSKKYTDIPSDVIMQYLLELKKLVTKGMYTISLNKNRQENIDFIENYRINTKKEHEILQSLECEDFCYAVDNKKPEFSHEKLYVFCKICQLDNWGTLEDVSIYFKMNLTLLKDDNYMIIISFHKLNKEISFPFK